MAEPFVMDPRLEAVATELARTGWASVLTDPEWRLAWVSDEMKILLEAEDDEALGFGKNLLECYLSETWSRTITEESQIKSFLEQGPVFVAELGREALAKALAAAAPDVEMISVHEQLLAEMEPRITPPLFTTSFDYVQGELPPIAVSTVICKLVDRSGEPIGNALLYCSALPAHVLAMVTRGDEGMFRRMSRLIEPGRRQAAVLFADLEESSVLSRRLPSGAYFRLIRSLTTVMDEVVVEHEGIVGKHAGDGVSAFFLSDDLGSPSDAARAAIETARKITEVAGRAAKEMAEATGLFDPTTCLINVGVHWGGRLYMGQLVTGGRLEVTALGDEVNECARIQESAREGTALASKSLIEHLSDEHAHALGIDPEGVVYRTVGELDRVSEKAVRDAGGIPVTTL